MDGVQCIMPVADCPIPYHTGLLWLRFATNNAEADLWPNAHALLEWEEGWEYIQV